MGFRDVTPEEASRKLTEDVIKQWRDKRQERLAKDREAEILKKQETELKSWLIEVFKKQKYEGMMIDQRVTGLSTKEIRIVTDRESFIKFIYENEAIDLLQFRPVDSAIAAREEEGVI